MSESIPAERRDSPSGVGRWYLNKIVLVTGGGGFIGSHLVQTLVAHGADVQCTALPHEELQAGTAHVVDIRDEVAIGELVARLRPDVVFHLAGVVDTSSAAAHVSRSLHGNLVASVNVLLAAHEAGVQRVVLTGSSEEITGAAGVCSPYAAAKLSLRPWVGLFRQRYGLDVLTLRPFMAYGPGQPPHRLVPQVALHLLAGMSPTVKDPERVCDFIYIDDVVEALLHSGLADRTPADDYDVGTGRGTRVRDACETLRSLVANASAIDYVANPASVEPHIAYQSGRRLPDWSPSVELEEGLRRTVEWYRADTSARSEELGV